METVAHQYSSLVSKQDGAKQAVIIMLQTVKEVTLADGSKAFNYLTDAQIDVARLAAKACLQNVGATVLDSSTAFVLPAVELNEGETAKLKVDASIIKVTADSVENSTETDSTNN